MVQTDKTHKAWTFFPSERPSYVQEMNTTGKGDKYSYTHSADNALLMTEQECRDFCSYRKQCQSVGFWS